jgi:ABC-2 type transport system permease protein
MLNLIRIEAEKIVLRRLNQIVLGISAALIVLIYILLWLTTDVVSGVIPDAEAVTAFRSSLYLEGTFAFAMFMLYAVGTIGGIVVAGSNVGAEYGWNTIRTIVAAEPRRWPILVAKIVTIWLAVNVGMLIVLVVALMTSTVITLLVGEFRLDFVDGAYLRESGLSYLRLQVGLAPYLALAVLLGTWGKSAVAGIALAIGVAFLEGIVGGLMSLAGGWVAEIPRFLLDHNSDNLALANGGPLGGMMSGSPVMDAFDRPSVAHSVVVLTIWTIVFVGAAFALFQRQDLDYQG